MLTSFPASSVDYRGEWSVVTTCLLLLHRASHDIIATVLSLLIDSSVAVDIAAERTHIIHRRCENRLKSYCIGTEFTLHKSSRANLNLKGRLQSLFCRVAKLALYRSENATIYSTPTYYRSTAACSVPI
ncbi:unnamed protein product [Leptidea sinapis]|uniref:Uncharacterized protein n=1 Tax=Leptidea sinapis TaxID=189913 RepID=A0A5E4QAD8_9NEOP|nr:unnamed protein product [Leptidea sinapis]